MKELWSLDELKDVPFAVVDFWAQWCSPCNATLINLKDYERDGITLYKSNVEKQPDIASKFKIMSIPTFVFFKNGNAVKIETGTQTKESLNKIIDELYE